MKNHLIQYLGLAGIGKILALLNSSLWLYFLTLRLEPSKFANYSIIISTGSLLSAISFTWLYQVLIKFYTHNSEVIQKRTIFMGKILSGIIFLIFVCLSVIKRDMIWIVIALLGLSAGWWGFQLQRLNSGKDHFRYNTMIMVKNITSLVLIFFCNELIDSVYDATVLLLISNFISLFIIWITIKQRKDLNTTESSNVDWEKIRRYSWPFVIISFFTLIIDFADRIMLKDLISEEASGIYSANYDMILLLFGGSLSVITLYFLPLIFGNKEKSKDVYLIHEQLFWTVSTTLIFVIAISYNLVQ